MKVVFLKNQEGLGKPFFLVILNGNFPGYYHTLKTFKSFVEEALKVFKTVKVYGKMSSCDLFKNKMNIWEKQTGKVLGSIFYF